MDRTEEHIHLHCQGILLPVGMKMFTGVKCHIIKMWEWFPYWNFPRSWFFKKRATVDLLFPPLLILCVGCRIASKWSRENLEDFINRGITTWWHTFVFFPAGEPSTGGGWKQWCCAEASFKCLLALWKSPRWNSRQLYHVCFVSLIVQAEVEGSGFMKGTDPWFKRCDF